MISLAISQQLDNRERWQKMLSHQLNVYLAPLRQDFSHTAVSFFYNESVYTCSIRISRQALPAVKISATHSDGLIAIGQAMARSKRTLVRGSHQFKQAGN
jgi:ribosome-associated translation inhibitor RaiA